MSNGQFEKLAAVSPSIDKSDKLFAFTLKRKAPAADFINGRYRFHTIIHSFRDKEHMVTVLDFVYSTFIFSVNIFLEHVPYRFRQQADVFFCIWYCCYCFCHYFYLLFLSSGIAGISYLHLQYAGFCQPQNIGKTQKPRCRQRQRGFKTKKGTNTTANPSYVLRKFFFPHLLYIVYQIFRLAQIFVGFFGWQQMTTIGIQCSIRQPVQYSSAGIRNFAFLQQFFVPSYLYTGEQSLLPATVLPSGLTGPHSPARLIFFIWQISDFRLRTTFLPRRLRRR